MSEWVNQYILWIKKILIKKQEKEKPPITTTVQFSTKVNSNNFTFSEYPNSYVLRVFYAQDHNVTTWEEITWFSVLL